MDFYFFYPVETLKYHRLSILLCAYIPIVQVNGFILTRLIVFGWASVNTLLCEFVASGMSS